MNNVGKEVEVVFQGRRIAYICPKCRKPVLFGKKYIGRSLCMRCGQRLLWGKADNLKVEILEKETSVDAAISAERYFEACGMKESEWFNLDDWRRSLRGKGCSLYLLFKGPKEYGRFKRLENGGHKK